MDFRSSAPLERPEVADHSDTHTEDGRAQNARPRRERSARPLRTIPYDIAEHYPLIVSWWKARESECLPADVLPPTGSVAVLGGKPVAACFIWLMNGRASFLAFPISAPGLDARTAYRAVRLAIDGAVAIGREAGCRLIWTSTTSASVDRLYSRAGFTHASPHIDSYMLIGPDLSPDMVTD